MLNASLKNNDSGSESTAATKSVLIVNSRSLGHNLIFHCDPALEFFALLDSS